MRRWLTLLSAVTLCVGCTPGGVLGSIASAGGNPVKAAGTQVVVTATQGLILANLTYQTLATPVAVGMERGLIKGQTKVRLKELSAKVAKALADAKAAKSEAQRAALAAQALGDLNLISQLSGVPLPKF